MPKQPASLLILNGKSAGNEEKRPAVKFYRQEGYPLFVSVTWAQGDAPNEITFNLDGEPLRGRQFHITVIPAALICRLPPRCPLLA